MAKAPFKPVTGGFGNLPGRVKAGSQADLRKSTTISARDDMAEVLRRYNALVSSLKVATPELLERTLSSTFFLSQLYVPHKTGALQESGKLESGYKNGQAVASITYGNAKVWYAALVHEFIWLNHEFPTQAKYLQAAMEQTVDFFLDELAENYTNLMLG